MQKFSIILAAAIVSSPLSFAKKTHSGRTKANTPEEQLAGFTVHKDFVIELVASEKDGVVNPIDLTFDDAGRLWTQTARMYPLDPVKDIKWNILLKLMDNPAEQDKNPEFKRIKDLYQGKTKGTDDILILSNLGSKQRLEVKKFATGLTIPQSILPYKNGAFVAQGSELFFLNDTNNDGKADKRVPVLTGFGFTDTHTMAHSLVRAPGGWIHFSQGALNKGDIKAVRSGESTRIDYSKIARFSLDGNHIELVNAGLNNIWGFQLRGNGQWFLTEANDLGHSVNPAEPGTGFKGIGNERLRPYQPIIPVLHKFRVGGTGISGLAFSDDTAGGFPREWKDVAFLANPITSTINCVRTVRNPDGTVTSEHLPDLLTSKDDWFRPVNIEFGPDGCLYIADWYNKIVSHNELPTTHPDRDKSHGRIWRIRHKSQKPRSIPNLYKVSSNDLFHHLKSPFLWEKRAAWHQIVDRKAKEHTPGLSKMATSGNLDKTPRIHALWALEGLGSYSKGIMREMLNAKDGDIRREAVRSLATFKPSPDDAAELLTPLINDKNVMVRSQIIRTLEDLGKANLSTIDILVSYCRPALPGNSMGGSYERSFERYLARKALEKYPTELKAYLSSDLASKQPATHLVWAMQALGNDAAVAFTQLWDQIKDQKMNLPDLIIVANMAKHRQVYQAVFPTFKDKKNALHLVTLALSRVEDTYTPSLANLLQPAVDHLLKSKNEKHHSFALQAIRKFDVPVNLQVLEPLLAGSQIESTIRSLAQHPGANKALFLRVLSDQKNPVEARLAAAVSLGALDPKASETFATGLLKDFPKQRGAIINSLGSTTHGGATLLRFLHQNLIKAEDISYDIADRIRFAHPKNPQAIALHKAAVQKRNAEKQAAMGRLPALTKLAENSGGTPAIGQALFKGMCLSCHVVGEEGIGIAPALDGSSKREPEALLTALLDPDAAAEGAYVLYRVITKHGYIIEGYRKRSDATGTIVSSIGGSETFIPAHKIARADFAGSRSFMPAGLISSLPDETIEHLLAYIRTLK